MDYVLITDANCDLPAKIADDLKINVIPMEFIIENKSYKHYLDAREMSLSEFYAKLKDGKMSQTSQINYADFVKHFEPFLKEGKDIVYVCFTSGLSGTYNTCQIAINDLKEKYPDRKITAIDSLCASVGQGILMYYVGQKYCEGLSFDELINYTNDIKMRCCHWFVVDDLDQLKRGGRISAVTATFGKALQIKPLLTVDNEGKLITAGKIRGTSKVFETLIEKMQRDADNYKEQTIFIGHADAHENAKELQSKVAPMVKDTLICNIGPVIGTHVGSGMLAILFIGKRNLS